MLEIQNVYKNYKNISVLSGLNLSIESGKAIGLTGKNGSGKSTLIEIVAQTQTPNQGDILENNISVLGNKDFLKTKLGYVPQDYSLAEFLTVEQQLELWQSAVGEKNQKIIVQMGLSEIYKKKIHNLSGGQKKRVSIAMALQNNPKYLLLDEAFSSLDVEHREKCENIFTDMLKEGLGILYCSHDIEEVRNICCQTYTIAEGKSVLIHSK